MKTHGIPIFLASCLWLSAASGETPPEGPLIVEAPIPSTWTVNYEYGQTDGKGDKPQPRAQDRITSVRVEKTESMYHQVVTYASGAKLENWQRDDIQLCKNANSDSFIYVSPENPLHAEFDKNQFGCFSWIGTENFVSRQQRDGREACLFEVKNSRRRLTDSEKAEVGLMASSVAQGSEGHDKAHERSLALKNTTEQYLESKFGSGASRAFIDAKTHLPIEYSDGISTRTFNFLGKAEISDVPVGVLDEIERRKAASGARLQQPPPP